MNLVKLESENKTLYGQQMSPWLPKPLVPQQQAAAGQVAGSPFGYVL